MELWKVINLAGLAVGLVGVAIIFVWGPPMPKLDEGVGLSLEDGTRLSDGRTVADHNEDTARRRRRHETLSKVGLALVGASFVLQGAATWAAP